MQLVVSTRRYAIAAILCALLVICALVAASPAARASGGSDSLGARSLATDWYFAEGTTRDGFTTYIAVMNPNPDAADVTFTYMLGLGDPVVRTHRVAAASRFTIDLSLDVGPGRDVATFIHSTLPVVAERPMYFIYQGKWNGGDDSLGATRPARQWFFAEGTTRVDFVTYLAVLNPNNAASDVTFTYLPGSGQPVIREHTVAAMSRFTVDVAADLGPEYQGRDVSTIVESALPVVAERPMYFDYQGKWDGGHDSLGAQSLSTEWDFAEGTTRDGFVTYLTVANPGEAPSDVTMTYMLGSGKTVIRSHEIPSHSRFTIDVSADVGAGQDVSTTITSTVPVAAERPMYFDYQGKWTGGSDVVGANFPASNWYFAEGSCRTNFEPYICILNPGGDTADIRITYMKGNGTTQEQTASVPARARATIPVSSVLGTGDDPAHDFSAQVTCTNGDVICERPTYFDYQGKWDGGFDVMGATMASSTCYFAEGSCRPGFDAYLCVQNPGNTAASVQVTYMKGDSTTAVQATTVPARSRATLHPADVLGVGNDSAHDFAATVTCDTCQQIIVERPMYFDYQSKWTGGSDVLGYVPGQ